MAAVRSEVRYHRLQEEEEAVTVRLYSQPLSVVAKHRYQETCCRIFSSVLLLAVAASFVFYDLRFGNEEPPIAQQRFLDLQEEHDHKLPEHSPPQSGHEETEEEEEEEHRHHHHGSQTSKEKEDEEDENPSPSHHHSAGTFHHAAAVTDSETCSMLARDVLHSGGSVVDAGITAVFCLVVVHPHTSSLGGIFSSIVLGSSSQNSSVLNAIPTEASPVQYGVPQVLQGLWLLHQAHGKTPWSQLVNPAIILADQGFLVDSGLRVALEAHQDRVVSSAGLCGLFCKSDHSLLEVGERVKNPALARLLERVAASGTGSRLPDDLIQSLVDGVEVTEREKLIGAIFRSSLKMEDSVTLNLDGLTLHTTGHPTAGGILSNAIQEVYKITKKQGLGSISEVLLNSSKIMYAEGGAWPRELPSNVSSKQLPPWNRAPVGSNVIVANSLGELLVLSHTLNSTFGSGFVSPSTGVLLSDFVQGLGSTPSSTPQYWACPSILVSDEGSRVTGLLASGGSSAPFSLAKVMVGHLLLDKDLLESVNGSLVEAPGQSSDPWLGYFGLQGKGSGSVMAVEVEAEHVHVVNSFGASCYPAGL
ncbi:glutathione hydrolase 6 [Gastrophryne carolinensis]